MNPVAVTPGEDVRTALAARSAKSPGFARIVWKRMRHDRYAMMGLIVMRLR